MIHIIVIRHGRTAWNVDPKGAGGSVEVGPGERFRGTLDVPLAAEGIAQARVTAHRLAGWPLAAVYTSPLQRAAHTAELLASPHHLVPQRLAGLSSMNYGEWAGQPHADVALRWPDLYRAWRRDPYSIRIPGGECMADLRERAIAALRSALDHHADGETLAFVTHQVVAKVLTCSLAGLPDTAYWHVRQDLCNLSRFDYDPQSGIFAVVSLNDTCHLTPALARMQGRGTRIILIRHGQTGWNAGAGEERFRGRTDLPLDDYGHTQVQAVAEWLSAEPVSALYSSPLLRARQTLALLADAQGLPVQVHDGLIDIDYGAFQGLTHTEAQAAYPDLYRQWRTAPSQVRFPGGQSLTDVQERLQVLVAELVTRHPDQTVVLVGHEIVNKVLACTLLGLDLDHIWRIHQDTTGIDVFQQDGDAWTTLALNDTCHLAGGTG